jgi:hypothetical protein
VIREGTRLVQEREARFRALDAANARGLDDLAKGARLMVARFPFV